MAESIATRIDSGLRAMVAALGDRLRNQRSSCEGSQVLVPTGLTAEGQTQCPICETWQPVERTRTARFRTIAEHPA